MPSTIRLTRGEIITSLINDARVPRDADNNLSIVPEYAIYGGGAFNIYGGKERRARRRRIGIDISGNNDRQRSCRR